MNRVWFSLAPEPNGKKLRGTIEADETYVGGKPRYKGTSKRGRGTNKIPVFAAVERGRRFHHRVVADVKGETLRGVLRELVSKKSRIITDEHPGYRVVEAEYAGGHDTVCHGRKEYVRGDISTNTAEGSFALVKRSLTGIYHNVSKDYLHRYLWQFDFLWNNRTLSDGDRTALAIRSAEGKRLRYKSPDAA